MNKNLLVYLHDESIDKSLLESMLKKQGYILQLIETNSLNQSIGYLMQLDGFSQIKEENTIQVDFDIMVLPFMEQTELKLLTTSLKEASITIELKAMLTEHNQSWSLLALMEEVHEEHQYFVKRYELQNLIMACTKLDQKLVNSAFQSEIMQAYDVLQSQESRILDFEQAINVLLPKYSMILSQT